MDTETIQKTNPVRFEEGTPILVAGISKRYAYMQNAGIPGQWQAFGARLGNIPGRIGMTTYGVCSNFEDEGNYDYLSGVEVSDFSGLPKEFTPLRMASQYYAVFAHRDPVAAIMETWKGIWNWMPESGFEAVDAPQFEKYGQEFNPRTGMGGFEIWIPVTKK